MLLTSQSARSAILATSIAALFLTPSAEAQFVQVWQVGIDNGTQTEFAQENGSSNLAPGSATLRDDDWYFAGTYPDPIGVLVADEANSTFERALTLGDRVNRVHFNLAPALTLEGTEFRLLIDTVSNQADVVTNPIPFTVQFNGVQVFSGSVSATAQFFTTPTFFVGGGAGEVTATTGDNVVTFERPPATGAGWMQFDYVRLEAVPEPTTGLSLAAGTVLLSSLRRRRK